MIVPLPSLMHLQKTLIIIINRRNIHKCGSKGNGRAVGLDDLVGLFQPCDSIQPNLFICHCFAACPDCFLPWSLLLMFSSITKFYGLLWDEGILGGFKHGFFSFHVFQPAGKFKPVTEFAFDVMWRCLMGPRWECLWTWAFWQNN